MKIGFADGILHSQITVIRPQQFMLRAVLNSYNKSLKQTEAGLDDDDIYTGNCFIDPIPGLLSFSRFSHRIMSQTGRAA